MDDNLSRELLKLLKREAALGVNLSYPMMIPQGLGNHSAFLVRNLKELWCNVLGSYTL